MRLASSIAAAASALALMCPRVGADDERYQYPHFLANAYFDVGVGYIDYPFSSRQLEPGFQVESIQIPHAAVRVGLLGYRFDEHFAVQLNYVRPVQWVGYVNVNGVPARRSVWMNLAGVTFRGTIPLAGPLLLDAEAGMGLVTRHGFEAGTIPVVRDVDYWTALLGGGLRYRLNRSWDLGMKVAYSPSNSTVKQPHSLMVSGGFTYNMRPLPEERVAENAQAGFVFPRNLVQFGYASDAVGYHLNGVVSGHPVPIFWGGLAQVKHGFIGRYQRNVFHTRKVFSLDFGASVSAWNSRVDRKDFYALSVFPEFRFTPLRLQGADFYLNYSLAGPTSISRVAIDGNDTGRHFTFQDFMGLGVYAGKDRHVNAEVHIGHYSNGNLFSHNAGVSIPLTFDLGYSFH